MTLDFAKRTQRKNTPLLLIFLLFCFAPAQVVAFELGVGARNFVVMYEIGNKFSDSFNFRLALGGLEANANDDINSAETPDLDDILLNQSVDLELEQLSGLIDYHPWQGAFRFTGGVTHSKMILNSVNFGDGEFIIGNRVFNDNIVDSTSLRVQLANGISPYFGFGWASGFGKEKGFSFNGDIGFIFSNNIEIDFTAQCSDSATNYQCKKVKSSVRKERLDLEQDLQLNFLPVVGFGLSYKF
ncbi:MAG: hypothetical protein P8J25_04295 [Porticoccaceae bacterium]|nr:hypothetical protein [Porticoccaceae bacterium]